MDAAPLVRLRWRLKGAWLWPVFVVLTLLDAVIVDQFPLTGNDASLTGGWLLGVILSLLAIIVLTAPITRFVRKLHPDMPRVVARNYAGAVAVIGVSASLLSLGLIHRHVITNAIRDLNDAATRAEAYIGAHAPAQFQNNLNRLSTFEVQAPDIYRVCASDPSAQRFYCVVVNRAKPFGEGVYYDGAESNAVAAAGTY